MTSRKVEEIVVTHFSNGMPLSLTLHTITGKKPGPVLGISAAVHGDEIIGAEILRRFFGRLNEEKLSGTILLLPVANPLAFENLVRSSPLDMNNLNRVFPGMKDGWVTEQIAQTIVARFLDKLDYYIDLHSGGAQPIVDYVYIQNDEDMSRAFNSPILYRPAHPYEGTTATYTVAKNIPSLTVEIGGGPNFELYIERGVTGIFNVMRHLKMLPEDVLPRPKQTVVTEIGTIRPTQGGLFVPALSFDKVGAVLEGEKELGRVYNPATFAELEILKAPYQRNLVILIRYEIPDNPQGESRFSVVATAQCL